MMWNSDLTPLTDAEIAQLEAEEQDEDRRNMGFFAGMLAAVFALSAAVGVWVVW